jgi:hypothetical protein
MKTSPANEISIPNGLIVHGQVLKRTRRIIQNKIGEEVQIVTYVISGDDKKKFYVDDYSPSDFYTVGSTVSIPVYVKPYTKKTGSLAYTLNVEKDFTFQGIGEDF